MILNTQDRFTPVPIAVAAAAVTAADQIDMSAVGVSASSGTYDWGTGEVPTFCCDVTTAFTTGGTSLTVTLVSADDTALTTNPIVHLTQVITAAHLVLMGVGPLFRQKLPSAGIVDAATRHVGYRRFLGVIFTPSGPLVAGLVRAYLVLDAQRNFSSPSGFRLPATV